MSGFLERLGARALGLAPLAQPLVPAIFDPGPGAAGGMAVPEPERAEPRHDRPAAPATALPAPAPGYRERAPRDARESAAWEGPRAALGEDEREREHDGRARDLGPQERAVDTLPPAAREVAIALAAPREGDRTETAEGRWSAPVPSVVPQVTLQAQQPLSTRDNHPTVAGRRDPAAATQGAPVIRVTIGRIDVRADLLAPAPARAASTPRAPTLSLDDYLKQRNEGQR